MLAGCDVPRASPKKTQALVGWPRPSRLEDVERCLAIIVFIRERVSPIYSEVVKPLWDVLVKLHEHHKSGAIVDVPNLVRWVLPPPIVIGLNFWRPNALTTPRFLFQESLFRWAELGYLGKGSIGCHQSL